MPEENKYKIDQETSELIDELIICDDVVQLLILREDIKKDTRLVEFGLLRLKDGLDFEQTLFNFRAIATALEDRVKQIVDDGEAESEDIELVTNVLGKNFLVG